jgi:hypothetical protein
MVGRRDELRVPLLVGKLDPDDFDVEGLEFVPDGPVN